MTYERTSLSGSYSRWFAAAGVYNLVWGAATLAYPEWLFRLVGATAPDGLIFWRVVGMLVLLYAPIYWWTARDPVRFRHYILVAVIGKIAGPIGFIWAATRGELPWSFGWTNVTNDLIWLPAFLMFLVLAARMSGGWARLARGD